MVENITNNIYLDSVIKNYGNEESISILKNRNAIKINSTDAIQL